MSPDIIVVLLTGALTAGCGFLAGARPDLIAGYNTMSAEKKKNVDIRGLSTFLRKWLVALGAAHIAVYFILRLAGAGVETGVLTACAVLFIGIPSLSLFARRYDHNKRR
ncbi:MAG: DUF3784 domain-containing protein [Rikenellaceae bacterium]|jgi:hypothetical protein|nr:DUF3784 domain-containing protein [Rikenellaceae bacterium]